VNDVRAADEVVQFDVIGHLPREAQEALLKLAVGEKPEAPTGALSTRTQSSPTRKPLKMGIFILASNARCAKLP
jgi:hypothetical protein